MLMFLLYFAVGGLFVGCGSFDCEFFYSFIYFGALLGGIFLDLESKVRSAISYSHFKQNSRYEALKIII